MRLLILSILGCSLSAAASFSLTAARIDGTTAAATSACHTAGACNGWSLELDTSSSVATGGTYDLGFSQSNNNATANAKIIVTVTSSGYNCSSGSPVPGTITRTIYGTHELRQPYPNPATNDETNSGGAMTFRIALSDQIYSGDTVTSVQIVSSFYTDGSGNTIAPGTLSGAAITNNSTYAYSSARAIANWTRPGWQRAGSTLTVGAFGAQRHAMNGRPLACMVFTATDGHAHTVSQTVLSPTIDFSQADAAPVQEYLASLSMSTLTQSDLLTVNFAAYPWVGDATSVMDSSDGVNAQPTPLYAPQYYINDKSGTYGTAAAVVDASAGSDSNSCAVAESTYVQGTTPPGGACLTIAGAAAKMEAFNSANYSRTVASGTMYLKTGNYAWMGSGAATSNTTANVWLTITPFSGVSGSSVVIASQSGNSSFGGRCTSGTTNCGTPLHLKGITINITGGPVSVFDNITYLWFDGLVSMAVNGTAPVYQTTVVYATQGAIGSIVNGLGPFGTTNSSWALIRGVDMTGSGGAYIYTIVGSTNHSIGVMALTNFVNGQAAPFSTAPIVAFNTFYRTSGNSGVVDGLFCSLSSSIGAAIVQNIFEFNATSTAPLNGVSNDSCTQARSDNVMLWQNVMVGERLNRAYNDTGSSPLFRLAWSEVGDIRDQEAIKSDTFPSGSGPDAARVGNWSVLYGVGRRSTINAEVSGGTTGFPASGSFQMEFGGLWSYNPTTTCGATNPCGSSTNAISFPVYVSRQAYDGTNPNAGNGDYRLKSNSPAINLVPAGRAVLPYDLAGQVRDNSGHGSAGAFAQEIVNTKVMGW